MILNEFENPKRKKINTPQISQRNQYEDFKDWYYKASGAYKRDKETDNLRLDDFFNGSQESTLNSPVNAQSLDALSYQEKISQTENKNKYSSADAGALPDSHSTEDVERNRKLNYSYIYSDEFSAQAEDVFATSESYSYNLAREIIASEKANGTFDESLEKLESKLNQDEEKIVAKEEQLKQPELHAKLSKYEVENVQAKPTAQIPRDKSSLSSRPVTQVRASQKRAKTAKVKTLYDKFKTGEFDTAHLSKDTNQIAPLYRNFNTGELAYSNFNTGGFDTAGFDTAKFDTAGFDTDSLVPVYADYDTSEIDSNAINEKSGNFMPVYMDYEQVYSQKWYVTLRVLSTLVLICGIAFLAFKVYQQKFIPQSGAELSRETRLAPAAKNGIPATDSDEKVKEEQVSEKNKETEEFKASEDKNKVEESRKLEQESSAAASRIAAKAKAEEAKASEEARKAEEERAAEESRLAAEAKAAEEARASEEARKAEEVRAAEESRLAAEAKVKEEARASEEARKAEEERAAEESRLAEEAKAKEEAKASEEARIAEEERAAEEARLAEEAKAKQESESAVVAPLDKEERKTEESVDESVKVVAEESNTKDDEHEEAERSQFSEDPMENLKVSKYKYKGNVTSNYYAVVLVENLNDEAISLQGEVAFYLNDQVIGKGTDSIAIIPAKSKGLLQFICPQEIDKFELNLEQAELTIEDAMQDLEKSYEVQQKGDRKVIMATIKNKSEEAISHVQAEALFFKDGELLNYSREVFVGGGDLNPEVEDTLELRPIGEYDEYFILFEAYRYMN